MLRHCLIAALVFRRITGSMTVMMFVVAHLLTARQTLANDQQKLEHFEKHVRPILAKHCYRCHSEESGKAEGSLQLDTRDGIRRGGDRGSAVVPGKPDESVLLDAVRHTSDDLKMPPREPPMAREVIENLRVWIASGAIDPRDKAAVVVVTDPKRYWSYQPIARQPLPKVSTSDWPRSRIDYWILAQLDAAKLAPSDDAAPSTLLRRLSFDLLGLPPSIDEVATFETKVKSQGIEQAIAEEVDRMLADPAFGERWGRHWLDVARYAESSGKEANITFPYAWRYRDYVIDAMNRDLPFSQFVVEQLAGDLIETSDPRERARLLIATGFLAIGPKNLDEASKEQFDADLIDEQIDAYSRAILGSSLACARCHDHKFAPYSMHDYYAVAGIFRSTRTYFGTYVTPANRIGGDPLELPGDAGAAILHKGIAKSRVDQLKTQLASLRQQEANGMARVMKAAIEGRDPEKEFTITDALRIFWTAGGIEGELERVDDEGKPLPLAMGVCDQPEIVSARLLERGEIAHPGDEVPRGVPQFLASISSEQGMPTSQSGRLELARWIVRDDHPLTSRVMANRVWRQLFSQGIVRTVDLFEPGGEAPSHPELLDELAISFVEKDWSIKQLIREIVLSRTYRQSSTYRPEPFATDPDNRLLWRMSPKRLDAEAIRDSMLVASGELDRTRVVGSLVANKIGDRPVALLGLDRSLPADLDGSLHRSVYLPILRDRLPDVLELLDFAEPSLVTGDRQTTNVPLQSLYFLNSPFVVARARAIAAKVAAASDDDLVCVEMAIARCYGRSATADERSRGAKFLRDAIALKASRDDALTAFCQSLMASAEFRNLD